MSNSPSAMRSPHIAFDTLLDGHRSVAPVAFQLVVDVVDHRVDPGPIMPVEPPPNGAARATVSRLNSLATPPIKHPYRRTVRDGIGNLNTAGQPPAESSNQEVPELTGAVQSTRIRFTHKGPLLSYKREHPRASALGTDTRSGGLAPS